VKNVFAVTMTAALVLTAAGTPAFAQDETITVEGLFYIDRNGDNAYNAGENVRAGGPGVQIRVQGTNELVGTFPAGPDGRYRAVLPKGPEYVTSSLEKDYSSTVLGHDVSESRTDADYPLRGYFLNGFTFVDSNGDGVKQADEKTHAGKIKVSGQVQSGAQFSAEAQAGADGAYQLDLPLGALTLTAPDLTRNGLALAKPKSGVDVDWVTGTLALGPAGSERDIRADARYFEPEGDGALEGTAISPAKDTYVVGDQIEVEFKLLNKGDVPGKLSVVVFGVGPDNVELISLSDNVTGTMQEFETVAKLMPGESITVKMKLEIVGTGLTQIGPFARPFIGGFKDVDHKNQGQPFYKQVKVVEKGATTEPSTPSSSAQTTTPTTTTTAPAVAKAGNKSGLASTGASVLGFLGLGAVLLAAGVSVFFVARRRRS
jgi:hypothetical protein